MFMEENNLLPINWDPIIICFLYFLKITYSPFNDNNIFPPPPKMILVLYIFNRNKNLIKYVSF